MEDEDCQKLKDYALKLLSFRPRSQKEITSKLQQYCIKKGFPIQTTEKVIAYLLGQNFISDYDFVKWWIDQRQSFNPRGMRVIKQELLSKGISKEIIEEILVNSNDGKSKEVELAKQVINKKQYLLKKLSARDKKIKISQYLAGRGFDWDTIYKVIDSN